MIERWLEHLYNLDGGYGQFYFQSGVPDKVIFGIQLAIFLLFVFWSLFDRKEHERKGLTLLLTGYIFFLICSTVIFRPESAEVGLKKMLFWKLLVIEEGKEQYKRLY